MSGQTEYFIKTFEADGEKSVSGSMSFEAVQNWVLTEGFKTEFEVFRENDLKDCTESFTRDRRFISAKQNYGGGYEEPLTFLTV